MSQANNRTLYLMRYTDVTAQEATKNIVRFDAETNHILENVWVTDDREKASAAKDSGNSVYVATVPADKHIVLVDAQGNPVKHDPAYFQNKGFTAQETINAKNALSAFGGRVRQRTVAQRYPNLTP